MVILYDLGVVVGLVAEGGEAPRRSVAVLVGHHKLWGWIARPVPCGGDSLVVGLVVRFLMLVFACKRVLLSARRVVPGDGRPLAIRLCPTIGVSAGGNLNLPLLEPPLVGPLVRAVCINQAFVLGVFLHDLRLLAVYVEGM